jgi:hypothetical protein
MSEQTSGNEDAAWVTIDTPFDRTELRLFLEDVERLYRINPMLVFDQWQKTADQQYQLKAKNLSNNQILETTLDVEPGTDGIIVNYQNGLRSATSFRIEEQDDGSVKLVVTDDYSGVSLSDREARIDEVDKSLVTWGGHLHRYLYLWKRWSWLPGWQFYMRKVWQPMKPMARRITQILLMITLAEFVLFLLVFTVFTLELDKYIN